jgi:ubiquinone/menaquinone biosynthesis C-methylase UbiE
MGFYANWVVPRLIDLAMGSSRLADYRRRVVGAAAGRVLEIGVGSGRNLPFYTGNITEAFALDPSPKLLEMARAMDGAPTPIRFLRGSAEAVPLDRAAVDMVLMTWTLCSIPDAARALDEIRRVLKPGGTLLFVEHGLAPDPGVVAWQYRLTPLWKHLAGGCHLDRPIERLIAAGGFRIADLAKGYMRGPKPMTFMYEGRAHPR